MKPALLVIDIQKAFFDIGQQTTHSLLFLLTNTQAPIHYHNRNLCACCGCQRLA
jgi:hypothetical protein